MIEVGIPGDSGRGVGCVDVRRGEERERTVDVVDMSPGETACQATMGRQFYSCRLLISTPVTVGTSNC